MRIRVSSPTRFPKTFTEGQIRQFQNEVAESIYEAIGDRTLGLSKGRIEKLIREIYKETEKESAFMFKKAVDIIMRSKSRTLTMINNPTMRAGLELTAFRASDLGSGGAVGKFAGMPPQGSVNWQDLSLGWVSRKWMSRPSTARSFFVYTGSLLNYLKNPGYQSSKFRQFGGVVVNGQGLGELKDRKLTRGEPRFALAHLEIKIFPSIPAALLPMMATNRWNSTTEGSFEKRMFGGVVGEKLAGPEGRHRPLFQPLTQFWIAYRMPRAIQRAVNRTLKVRDV